MYQNDISAHNFYLLSQNMNFQWYMVSLASGILNAQYIWNLKKIILESNYIMRLLQYSKFVIICASAILPHFTIFDSTTSNLFEMMHTLDFLPRDC